MVSSKSLRRGLIEINRPIKKAFLTLADAFVFSGSLYLALRLRYGELPITADERFDPAYVALPVLGVAFFWATGLYHNLVRSMNVRAIVIIGFGSLLTGLLLPIWAVLDPAMALPRSVPFIYILLVLVGTGSLRLMLRGLYALIAPADARRSRVVIYGAGGLGNQTLRSLGFAPEVRIIGLVDDDVRKHGTRLAGYKVFAPSKLAHLIETRMVDTLLLTHDDIIDKHGNTLLHLKSKYQLSVKVVPRLATFPTQPGAVMRMEPLSLEDLLGREPVGPVPGLIDKAISNKVVLVTGAGGSIGSEICRQVLNAGVSKLIAFDISELALYRLQQEFEVRSGRPTEYLLGSVGDELRMAQVFEAYDIDIVFHAAAYKHVPLGEANALTLIVNNSFGTDVLARAAIAGGVGRFVLISTDKAVRPTNVMGASKRLAELVVQDHAANMKAVENGTIFSIVRFGNVLGSSGSVVPLFTRQIEEGGPITLTDRKIVRYFMTIEEAASLVLQAGSLAEGGEVYVLDMGKPVELYDLALMMIKLAGKRVAEDGEDTDNDPNVVRIRETGLRPGEKMYEELLIAAEFKETENRKIFRANENGVPSEELEILLDTLRECRTNNRLATVIELLEKYTEYSRPSHVN